MTNWFGSLGLAYKYIVVFLSLLVLAILAGLCKVFYNRRKLKKLTKEIQDQEAGRKDDQVELNQREKDEGDLFGVRAIEAGFFAGIPQSRPTSRAGSFVDSPSMSTSTLVGGVVNSPKVQTSSMTSSVTTLPLAQTNKRDSETLPSDPAPQRKTPPMLKLQPSEAELNGRRNHSAAVDMSLTIPPSPVRARGPPSPTFGDSDSGDGGSHASPRSLSPRSATFRPDHYAPTPPQIPLPEGLRVTVHSPGHTTQSLAASFNEPSPGNSAPPSPGPAPETKLPSMPAKAMKDAPNSVLDSEGPSSPIRLLPATYQPSTSHQRDTSEASSMYSNQNRMSGYQDKDAGSNDIAYNYFLPDHSSRHSVSLSAPKERSQRQSVVGNSLLTPASTTDDQTKDARLSEFYDAYYRHSQFGLGPGAEADGKRLKQLTSRQSTMGEVPRPLMQPGQAM